MKFSKSGRFLLAALVFFSITCVFVYTNYQKVKKEQVIIASEKQATASVIEVPRERVIEREKTIEIKEKMFIAQVNDVYLNQEDYLGKTIKLEGLFKTEQYAQNEPPYCFVLRYGPGCCGSDGNAGFEVAWNKEVSTVPYPADDDWVLAVGTLQNYEEDGYPYLYLALSELTVLDKRGAEFVTQ